MMKNCIRLLSSLITLTFTLALTPAYANPTGGQVAEGAATITNTVQNGTPTTTITQTTNNAVIDWKGFDIGKSEHTHFQQPGVGSTAVNRIYGNNPVTIAGQLTATGQIILLNESSILFEGTSRVDVARLIAVSANSIVLEAGAKIKVPNYHDLVFIAPNIKLRGSFDGMLDTFPMSEPLFQQFMLTKASVSKTLDQAINIKGIQQANSAFIQNNGDIVLK